MHSSLKGITFKQNAVQKKKDSHTPAITIDVWARFPLPMLIQPSVNVHLAVYCKVLTIAHNISILTAGTLELAVNTHTHTSSNWKLLTKRLILMRKKAFVTLANQVNVTLHSILKIHCPV